jgi:hypothetical protein
MTSGAEREFIARTIYHHTKKTGEYVTLLVYKDSFGTYELRDDREAGHDFLSGTEDYIFEEWGNRNRQLIEDGFQRDNLMGYNKWQQFIS